MLLIVIDHIAVMVTGITGAGKSSACNFLMGDDIFEVDPGLLSLTSKSDSHSVVLNSRELKIIDTPGLCEDSKDGKENVTEFGKAVILARHGVHAIAIVINVSQRFTSSQVTLLKELELLDDLWSFMFIIFSAARSYGATDEEQREKIKTIYNDPRCPEELKKMLDRVGKRFMMLESTETNQDYRAVKLKEFLNMVDGIYHTNKRVYFNNLFEQAIKMYQEVKDKEKEYQEAILIKHMNEERERLRREQERQLQIMREETQANKERYQQEIRTIQGYHSKSNNDCNLLNTLSMLVTPPC